MTRTITQDLFKRRVPQIVGIYLGISWALLEFVGFMVDQYVLSPHLVTLSLVVLASLLPSVMVVAYFHGEPGRQGWTRAEKVAIPLNLVALGARRVVHPSLGWKSVSGHSSSRRSAQASVTGTLPRSFPDQLGQAKIQSSS